MTMDTVGIQFLSATAVAQRRDIDTMDPVVVLPAGKITAAMMTGSTGTATMMTGRIGTATVQKAKTTVDTVTLDMTSVISAPQRAAALVSAPSHAFAHHLAGHRHRDIQPLRGAAIGVRCQDAH